MARMHARTKGNASSQRPVQADLSFVEMKPKDVEQLILEYAREGYRAARIGLELRDQYGVPSVRKLTGKSITTIMKEQDLAGSVPEDLQNLVEKATRLKKHIEFNKRDTHNRRCLQLVESKIRRLERYYKRTGKLAQSWKY